ncbi:50S ribosomal protein L35 [Patescibacteria group bacterium]|jgi:ribosomal protein L35|nr:50S ribosomal protein L35 [Patescibacteria group bacterium]
MKTHKAISKRIRVTKTGKLLKLHGGQGHFNARNPGKITRKKRRDQSVAAVYAKNLKQFMPFAK